jgi:hypothetical protein
MAPSPPGSFWGTPYARLWRRGTSERRTRGVTWLWYVLGGIIIGIGGTMLWVMWYFKDMWG